MKMKLNVVEEKVGKARKQRENKKRRSPGSGSCPQITYALLILCSTAQGRDSGGGVGSLCQQKGATVWLVSVTDGM